MAVWLCAAAALARPVHASTIRADRDPQLSLTLAAQPQYAGVGRLDVDVFDSGPAAIGSATLIAPDWILTAGHMLDSARAVQFTLGGQSYSASRWIVHPKYTGDLIKGNDVALIQLTEPITSVSPARLYTGHNEFRQTGVFVGYGLSGTGLSGAVTDDRQARAVTNIIDGTAKEVHGRSVVQNKLPRKATQFIVDFDNPNNPLDSTTGLPAPTDLEGLISKGDSGGPVFLNDPYGGAPLLAGLHSFGLFFDALDDSDYGDVTGHTRVSRYVPWIESVITGPQSRKLRFVTPTEPFTLGTPMRLNPGDLEALGIEAVPEPGTASLFGVAGAVLLLRRKRR